MNFKWSIKELDNIPKQDIKVFSCFSGGGGSSLGYKLNGYDVIGNVEIDKRQNENYLANLKPKYNYNMDIRDVVKMAKNKELPNELYNLDILEGSAPCSSFSMSGLREKAWGKEKKFREGQKEQTLDDLFFIFGDLLNELKPKIVIGENVKGIIQGSAKENYAEPIIEMYQKMGYRAKYFVINSKNTNVPQSRTRVFFIGVRNDICTQEEFNELDNLLVFDGKEIPFSEVSKVANINESELKEIAKGTQQRYFWDNKIDTDKTFGDTNKRIYNKTSNFGDVIIHNDIPFPTLRASGSYMYYHKPFHISKEELILIQSFPYDYNFISNTNGNVHYILGMSVPPLMTKAISNVLVEYFIKKSIKVDIIDLYEF